MYKLRGKDAFHNFRDKECENPDEKENRKVYLSRSTWQKLDKESDNLQISRNQLVRQIIRSHFLEEEDRFLIQETLEDIRKRTEEIEKHVNPTSEEGYRDAGRILRGIRYNADKIEEEVLE